MLVVHPSLHEKFRPMIHGRPLPLHISHQVFGPPRDLLLVDTLLHQALTPLCEDFLTRSQVRSNSALQQTSIPACLLLSPDDNQLL